MLARVQLCVYIKLLEPRGQILDILHIMARWMRNPFIIIIIIELFVLLHYSLLGAGQQ